MLFLLGFFGFSIFATVLWGNKSASASVASQIISPNQEIDTDINSIKISSILASKTYANSNIPDLGEKKSYTEILDSNTPRSKVSRDEATIRSHQIPAASSVIENLPIAERDHASQPNLNQSLVYLAASTDNPDAITILSRVFSADYRFITSEYFPELLVTAALHNNSQVISLLSNISNKYWLGQLKYTAPSKLKILAELPDNPQAVAVLKEVFNPDYIPGYMVNLISTTPNNQLKDLMELLIAAVVHNNAQVVDLILSNDDVRYSIKSSPLSSIMNEGLVKLATLSNNEQAIAILQDVFHLNRHFLSANHLDILAKILVAAVEHGNSQVVEMLVSRSETLPYLKTTAGVGVLNRLAELSHNQEALSILHKIFNSDLPSNINIDILSKVLIAAAEYDNLQIAKLIVSQLETLPYLRTMSGAEALSHLAIFKNDAEILAVLKNILEPGNISIESMLKVLITATVHNNLDIVDYILDLNELDNREEIAILNEPIPKERSSDLLHLAIHRQNNKLVAWLLNQDKIEIKDPQYFLTCVLNHSSSNNVLNLFKIVHEAGVNKISIDFKDPETGGTILDYVMFKINSLQAASAESSLNTNEFTASLIQDIDSYKHLEHFLMDIGLEPQLDSLGPVGLEANRSSDHYIELVGVEDSG